MNINTSSPLPPIVSREEWNRSRQRLLAQEKALTRLKDTVSAQRRRLPMVAITEPYIFESENGPTTLLDLFDGRRQLIVQHFMFGTDWDEGCDGCSMMTDHIGPLSHLHARDTSFVLVSRAPLEKLLTFRKRMQWNVPWYSSGGSTFNEDFHVTVDGEELQGISVFLRDGERVFHTWSTYARGEEPFMVVFDLLDITPFGRQETWEDSPPGWPQDPPYEWMRLHDRYDQHEVVADVPSLAESRQLFGEPDGVNATWIHRDARQGFESASVRPHGDGHRLSGHTSAVEEGVAWTVGYQIDVDNRWRTVRADVREFVDGREHQLVIESDRAGHWTVDGVDAPQLDGCIDIDLESSALTNTIFLHRVQPSMNDVVYDAPAAFVRCAPLRLERIEQTYRRTTDADRAGEITFEYTSPAFDTNIELRFDPCGLVNDYPGLATRYS